MPARRTHSARCRGSVGAGPSAGAASAHAGGFAAARSPSSVWRAVAAAASSWAYWPTGPAHGAAKVVQSPSRTARSGARPPLSSIRMR